ncbi:MAG: nitrilase-related carbon-nitrogen hydrolase, partial [Candidatus Anammoxibacter sp.]
MKIALAQINPTIGAFKDNVDKICAFIDRARDHNCDLVVFSEMVVTGYPPRDLLERTGFISGNLEALDVIREHTDNIATLVGYVDINTDKKGKHLYNAAAFIQDKRIKSKHYKTLLPSYDVFDEHRYFEPAKSVSIVEFRRLKFGITICEDIWNSDDVRVRSIYNADPVKELLNQGAEFIINMSASPFENGKMDERLSLVTGLAVNNKAPFIY